MFDSSDQMSNYVGIKVPPWVTGTYERSNILILNYDAWQNKDISSFCQIVVHEFVHIVISHLAKSKCPIWLNEGLALYFAEQHKGMQVNNVGNIDLYELNYGDNYLYEISAKAVELLINEYGIRNILKKVQQTEVYHVDEILGEKKMREILQKIT